MSCIMINSFNGGSNLPFLVGIFFILADSVAIYLSSNIVNTTFGRLRGSVVTPNHKHLGDVEVFLGVPYAAPPVGQLRFMPPTTQKQWDYIRNANILPPVCPQKLPDVTNRREALKKMPLGRYKFLQRLLPLLWNQNEDCLYLNIYAPIRDRNERFLPVMVYIHGESLEWNSGNPYDGTVLASYGRVIVVTVNFRLGILGFLKHSLSEKATGNFGLLDQIAALHWIKENIRNFGGDPDNITIFGHGTGAALANLLLLSPIASKDGFIKRAILMSGSALSRWAVTSDPNKYTKQVAKALRCPINYEGNDLINCLRSKTVEELLAVHIQAPPFTTPLGPIIDNLVIKKDRFRPEGLDTSTLGKYELLYGVTSAESFDILSAAEEKYGMSEERKNRLLRAYITNSFDHQTNNIFTIVDREYKTWEYHKSTREKEVRDEVLHILGDAQIVAPVVNMGSEHSDMNSKSYFYVFDYQSNFGDYPIHLGTVHGEELAYVFGAPLVGGFSPFSINYTLDEQLLSELVMTLWTNFAKTGNPNLPPRQEYLTEDPSFDWEENLKRMWPTYDRVSQHYLHIDKQVVVNLHYRAKNLDVWNNYIPNLIHSVRVPLKPPPPKNPETIYLVPTVSSNYPLPFTPPPYQPPPTYQPVPVGTHNPPTLASDLNNPPGTSAPVYAGTPMSIVILIGILILVLNCFAMAGIYYKRDKIRFRRGRNDSNKSEEDGENKDHETLSDSEKELIPKPSQNGEQVSTIKSKSSASHVYQSGEVLLDTVYQATPQSDQNKKKKTKPTLSMPTLPRDNTSRSEQKDKDPQTSAKSINQHRRNKSENSIYSEVSTNCIPEDFCKKKNKITKSGTLPSKLTATSKSTSSITSIKSTSSRNSVKSSTSKTSTKSGSSKPLKKNASSQSLPTSEYSWGITKEMTMGRHEPEGRDDIVPDSQQTLENFHKMNYPKVLPNAPIVITESSIANRNRPHPPPRSTSLTAHELEELEEMEDLHVIYRKRKPLKRDASTDSSNFGNMNPFYGMGGGEAPASPTSVYAGSSNPTATVRRSSGIYGQFQPLDTQNMKPKVPLAPLAPLTPNIYHSRAKGFATFGKQDEIDCSASAAPIVVTTSSIAVVTEAAQTAFKAAAAPAFIGTNSKLSVGPIYNSSDSNNDGYFPKRLTDTAIVHKQDKKSPFFDSGEKSHIKPLKSALKQTSAYDKPKPRSSLSSSASINLSVVPNSSNSNSSNSSTSSIYASHLTGASNPNSQKKGAVVTAPTTRSKFQK